MIEFIPPPPEIPKEKLIEMQAFARKLMVKHPRWKMIKIQRKTAEHFKINLVDEKNHSKDSGGQDQ